MDKSDKIFVDQVIVTFLYYARVVDITMLVALSAILLEEQNPKNTTMKKAKKIILCGITPGCDSHVLIGEQQNPRNNRAVLNITQIIKVVMTLEAEAEIGAIYTNA